MAGSFIITGICAALAAFDIVSYKIPNAAILSGALAAFILRFFCDGKGALPDMAAGAALPFAICFILFALSMMGAGDIKLLMVVGIYAGSPLIIRIMAVSLFIAGAAALVRLIIGSMAAFRGFYFLNYMSSLILYITGGRHSLSGLRPGPYISKEEIAQRKPWLMHLSVPVAMGTAACLIFHV